MKTWKDKLPHITRRQSSCEIVGKRAESFQFSFSTNLLGQRTPEFGCNFNKLEKWAKEPPDHTKGFNKLINKKKRNSIDDKNSQIKNELQVACMPCESPEKLQNNFLRARISQESKRRGIRYRVDLQARPFAVENPRTISSHKQLGGVFSPLAKNRKVPRVLNPLLRGSQDQIPLRFP